MTQVIRHNSSERAPNKGPRGGVALGGTLVPKRQHSLADLAHTLGVNVEVFGDGHLDQGYVNRG